MKILALEFSSIQRSVAVAELNLPGALSAREAIEIGAHSNKPFEMIEEVLKQSGIEREQIERLAVGVGPGSYTGIRAAIAIAQGWQLAAGTPAQGLSSAEAVAAQAHAEGLTGPIAVIIDAQRGEFYLARHELSSLSWREVEPLRLASLAEVTACQTNGDLLVGPEVLNWFPKAKTIFPRASMLATLASARSDFTPG